jgi:hypothetical protein
MFCHEEEESQNSTERAANGMSLLEKMALWGRKVGQDNPEVDKSDLFEGVEDDGDHDVGHSELSAYGKAITSSAAYGWLVDSISKESLFYWGESQQRVRVERVKERILSRLPKGIISKREGPHTYKVYFHLPLRPLQVRIQEERNNRPEQPKGPISDLVVLTSSSLDQIQATTVEEYFCQTWADNGEGLSILIEEAMDGVSRSTCGKSY